MWYCWHMTIGLPTLLFLLFLTLKLLGHITWAWIWIFSPLLVVSILFLLNLFGGALLGGTMFGIASIIEKVRGK